MKVTVVNSSELMAGADNPTGCLSAHRYCSGCIGCNTLQRAIWKSKSVDGVLSYLKCKPKLTDESKTAIEKYYTARNTYREALSDLKTTKEKVLEE